MNEEQNQRRSCTSLAAALNLFWVILKHPVFGIAVGLIIAIGMYIATKAQKDPVFAVSKPDLIAQVENGLSKLRLMWENQELKNAAKVKVAIWNNGSRYIDKSDLTSENPIRIVPMQKVAILAVQVLKTSRPSLQFDPSIREDANGVETVVIKIIGDEALEKNDGALFHILYSGSYECRWNVIGRVKGVPGGFKEKAGEKVYLKKVDVFVFAVFITCSLGSIIIFRREIIETMRRGYVRGYKKDWLLIAYVGFLLFCSVFLFFHSFYPRLSAPSWLS